MKRTEQTLLEEMQLTEQQITRRKKLLHLTSEETALLANCREVVGEEIDTIVEEFYQVQTADEEISRLIGDVETLRRLHATQRQYILDLFSGSNDAEYVNNRLRIGLVHKRIGVEPRLYLAAVKLLKDILFRSLARHLQDPALLERTRQALDKLLYFDITLVFDTYTRSLLSEVETAKERIETYAASLEVQVAERTRELEQKVSQLQAALSLVKKLEGVIPICGICKKIRDDKESWQQLEDYLTEHSEAMFSHGLCPECFEKEMLEVKAIKEGKLPRAPNGK